MGTEERFERHREPCLCGRGEVVDVLFSPDYMYAGNREVLEVTCATCASRYEISGGSSGFVYELKAERAERARLASQVGTARSAFQGALGNEIGRRARAGGRTFAMWKGTVERELGFPVPAVDAWKRDVRNAGGLEAWVANAIRSEHFEALCLSFASSLPMLPGLLTQFRVAEAAYRAFTVSRYKRGEEPST